MNAATDTDTAADLAATYAVIDLLCAEAHDRLPSFEDMLEAARAILPGAVLDYQDDRRGHAGDSLGGRVVEVQTDRYRLVLSVDWLDRRGHLGEIVEGFCAPRGIFDARLYVTDRAAEARYRASRRRGKSRRAFGVDLAEMICRGETEAGHALRALVQQAKDCNRLAGLRA